MSNGFNLDNFGFLDVSIFFSSNIFILLIFSFSKYSIISSAYLSKSSSDFVLSPEYFFVFSVSNELFSSSGGISNISTISFIFSCSFKDFDCLLLLILSYVSLFSVLGFKL